MGIGEWVAYFFLLFFCVKGLVRSNRVREKLDKEGRVFGPTGQLLLMFYVLLLPWAVRKAEKDYVDGQEEIRKSDK